MSDIILTKTDYRNTSSYFKKLVITLKMFVITSKLVTVITLIVTTVHIVTLDNQVIVTSCMRYYSL